MKEIDLEKWEEFEEKLAELSQIEAINRKKTNSITSNYLYRGQANSTWPLVTTLERFEGLLTMEDYYKIVISTKKQVDTLIGITLPPIPGIPDYLFEIEKHESLPPGVFPAYEYFIYLRHNGFPSPLLDWTRSPYIAAYFAFRDMPSTADKFSIYAYCERPKAVKLTRVGSPRINVLGHYASGHRRHFLQQCEYTVCTIGFKNKHSYENHEKAFSEEVEGQDELWKLNLPRSERDKVLKKLEQYNINAFSLFGSEESLMEALSLKEIYFRNK